MRRSLRRACSTTATSCASEISTLRAIHTPGHASNHLCYLLEGAGLLFSGDHVMQGSTVVIGPPDGNMQQYLQSLARLQREPVTRIAPGHGTVIEDAQAEIARLIAHRLQREAKVVERLRRAGRVTIDVLVTSVYDDVDPRLHPVAKGSLLAHLLKLEADGRAARDASRCDLVDERVRPGAPLIELSRCSLVLDGHVVLDEIDFALRRGERWALIGPNGSGKTLLLKMLRGDVWPTPTGRERRSSVSWTRSRSRTSGPERQDKYVRYGWNLTVAQVVTTGLFDEDIPLTQPSRAQRQRVTRVLQRFGLSGLRRRHMLTLSYGQRRLDAGRARIRGRRARAAAR